MRRYATWIVLSALILIAGDLVSSAVQEAVKQAPSARLAERLPAKIQKIQKDLPDWLRKTGNKQAAALMKTMQEQIQAKQFEDAETSADSLLKIMSLEPSPGGLDAKRKTDKPPTGSQEETVRRLTEKVERVKAGAEKWAADGRDPAEIIMTMQEKFEPLMQAGKIAEAEAVVDGILKKLGMDLKAPVAPLPADESSAEELMVARVLKIQKELPAWVKKTGRKAEIDVLMKTLKKQLADRNFAEAEKTSDTIMNLMGVSISSQVVASQSSNARSPSQAVETSPRHAPDPFSAFFPQQLVFLASDRISLKPKQRDALLARFKATQPRLTELKALLETEAAQLAGIASRQRVDADAVLSRFDKFLNMELESKQLQARQGVAILNELTPEQHTALRELAGNRDAVANLEKEFKSRITAKIERVTRGAEQWAQSGRDPSPIAEAMQARVRPLMESGRVFEADAEIDRVLEQLKEEPK
ncbi:MAG: hypothetical protein NT172_11765 [Planctomycetota bacterium]|nr:hypothetical protein [Planctomycetota bacterium]